MILLRSYPKVTDWIFEIFHRASAADFRFLPLYSFGFFVAVAFFCAATIATLDLKRRESLGLMNGRETEITTGEAPSIAETIFYFLFGFVIFYKIGGIFTYQTELSLYILPLKNYMLSLGYGSWAGGIIGGAAISGYYYYSKNKEKLPQPEKKKVMVYPSDSMGDIVVIAAVLGVLGSNLFNYFESPGDYQNFWSDPVGSLFSGLSLYGGLICAGTGFLIYAYIRKFNIAHFFDSVAPGFILANGIGRIGCHVAGDGDWGNVNLHPKPGWIPQFLWSSHYEHNIIDADPGSIIPGCAEDHCHYLANAVYPTPLYEFLMCIAICLFLLSLRKRLTYKPGMIMTIFMILIGIQRFTIEQWRELQGRDLYHVFGYGFRQSELISIGMFTVGVAATALLAYKYKDVTQRD